MAAINPHDLDGLVIPRVVADKQYDVQTQLKKPLILQNKHDLGTSTDDLMAFYNPNKYADSGARVQLSKNITANSSKTSNVTLNSNSSANVTANISVNTTANVTLNDTANASTNATQYDKPINSERAEDWSTDTHDINYYRPNKYYGQKNASSNSTANVTTNATLAKK